MDRPSGPLPDLGPPEQARRRGRGLSGLARAAQERSLSDAHHAYDAREARAGREVMREVERRVMLSVLDRKWREHLYEMDYCKRASACARWPSATRSWSTNGGFLLWQAMNESVREEAVGLLFHVEVQAEAPAAPQPVHVSDACSLSSGRAAGEESATDSDGTEPVAPSASGHGVKVTGAGLEAPRPGTCTTRHPVRAVVSRGARLEGPGGQVYRSPRTS